MRWLRTTSGRRFWNCPTAPRLPPVKSQVSVCLCTCWTTRRSTKWSVFCCLWALVGWITFVTVLVHTTVLQNGQCFVACEHLWVGSHSWQSSSIQQCYKMVSVLLLVSTCGLDHIRDSPRPYNSATKWSVFCCLWALVGWITFVTVLVHTTVLQNGQCFVACEHLWVGSHSWQSSSIQQCYKMVSVLLLVSTCGLDHIRDSPCPYNSATKWSVFCCLWALVGWITFVTVLVHTTVLQNGQCFVACEHLWVGSHSWQSLSIQQCYKMVSVLLLVSTCGLDHIHDSPCPYNSAVLCVLLLCIEIFLLETSRKKEKQTKAWKSVWQHGVCKTFLFLYLTHVTKYFQLNESMFYFICSQQGDIRQTNKQLIN